MGWFGWSINSRFEKLRGNVKTSLARIKNETFNIQDVMGWVTTHQDLKGVTFSRAQYEILLEKIGVIRTAQEEISEMVSAIT